MILSPSILAALACVALGYAMHWWLNRGSERTATERGRVEGFLNGLRMNVEYMECRRKALETADRERVERN